MTSSDFGPLPRSFYARSVVVVARALLGKIIVHHSAEGLTAARIVETEAYRGPKDLAAHSAGGRRTPRTEVMYGEAGYAYMFLLYGMHWAFNIVVAKPGDPHAVLVRAVEPVEGMELMAARRRMSAERRELTNGPGKMCAALGLTRAQYGLDLTGSELYVAPGDLRGEVGVSTRINVDYAGEWAERPWRFYERNNRYVSVAPRT